MPPAPIKRTHFWHLTLALNLAAALGLPSARGLAQETAAVNPVKNNETAGQAVALGEGPATAGATWPMSSGPTGNYLPAPVPGLVYIQEPSQAQRLWESKVTYFGYGKSSSSTHGKSYEHARNYPGINSGNAGTPVVAEGLVFMNSIVTNDKPVEALIYGDRTRTALEKSRDRAIEKGMDAAEAEQVFQHTLKMWSTQADDIFFALDAESGEVVWEHKVPGTNRPNGKRDIWKPSPAYYDGMVFAISSTRVIRALNLQTGELVWEHDLGWDGQHRNNLLGMELDLIAVDGALIIPGRRPFALSTTTGERLWKIEDKKMWVQGSFTNPALWQHEGKTYLLYTDGKTDTSATYRLIKAATGKIIWTHAANGPLADPIVIQQDIAFATVGHINPVLPKKRGGEEEKYLPVRGGLKLTLAGPEVIWQLPVDENNLALTYGPGPDKGVRRVAAAGHVNGEAVFYYTPNSNAPGFPPTRMYTIAAATGKIIANTRQIDEEGFPMVYTKGPYVYEIGDHILHFRSGAGGDRGFGRTNFRRSDTLELVENGIPFEQDNPISTYEVYTEHPIVDGKIFIRTHRGTLVCWDLTAPAP